MIDFYTKCIGKYTKPMDPDPDHPPGFVDPKTGHKTHLGAENFSTQTEGRGVLLWIITQGELALPM